MLLRRLRRRQGRGDGAGRRLRPGRGRRRRIVRRAPETPGGEAGDGSADDEDAGEPGEDATPHVPRLRGRVRHERGRVVVVPGDAGVVLVDVELAVEPEVIGVRAEEPLRVRLAREHVPAFLLERGKVALANANRLVDVGGCEAPPGPGFPEAFTDLEHACLDCSQDCGKPPGWSGNDVDSAWKRASGRAGEAGTAFSGRQRKRRLRTPMRPADRPRRAATRRPRSTGGRPASPGRRRRPRAPWSRRCARRAGLPPACPG